MAGAVRAWAEGADLAEVLEACELTAGDFVRCSKQLLDVLRQLACLVPPEKTASDRQRALEALSANAARAGLDLEQGSGGLVRDMTGPGSPARRPAVRVPNAAGSLISAGLPPGAASPRQDTPAPCQASSLFSMTSPLSPR